MRRPSYSQHSGGDYEERPAESADSRNGQGKGTVPYWLSWIFLLAAIWPNHYHGNLLISLVETQGKQTLVENYARFVKNSWVSCKN